MEKITATELARLTPTNGSLRNKSNIRREAQEMGIDEIKFIPVGEWNRYGYSVRTKPVNIIQGNGRKFTTRTYKEGVAIRRIR